MKKISVVIHTYNSEKYIERCIKSVIKADEIIVCDMHSTDKSTEIAESLGCKVVYFDNVGFVEPARNFANSQVTSDYFLILDSDEYASEGLIDYLKDYINNNDEFEGARIPYRNEVLGKILKSYSKAGILRFFKKGCVDYKPIVHIMPAVKGKIISLPQKPNVYITHTMVDDLNEHILKWNHYTSLEVEKSLSRGKKFVLRNLLLRPIGEFFKLYFLKGGFRDGLHGFIFAIIGTHYKFMQSVKLWNHELKTSN